MRPFILRFVDYKSFETEAKQKMFEYSDALNLNVLLATNIPAVEVLNVSAGTFQNNDDALSSYGEQLFRHKSTEQIESATVTLVAQEDTDLTTSMLLKRLLESIKGETHTYTTTEGTDRTTLNSICEWISGQTHTREQFESTDIR